MTARFRAPAVAADFRDGVDGGSEAANEAFAAGVRAEGGTLIAPDDAALARLAVWVGFRFEVACAALDDDPRDDWTRNEANRFARLYAKVAPQDPGGDAGHVARARRMAGLDPDPFRRRRRVSR